MKPCASGVMNPPSPRIRYPRSSWAAVSAIHRSVRSPDMYGSIFLRKCASHFSRLRRARSSAGMSSQTVCSVACHRTSSSARRARLIWTSTVEPSSRHRLPVNEGVGPPGRPAAKPLRAVIIQCPAFIRPPAVLAPVLPSRCARCGAVSRDFLCPACLDFLVADRPMWLNPGLLSGPSLLDLTGGNEVAIIGADLSEVEWHKPAREPAATAAVRLVRLLGLDSDRAAIVSVGDAEVLHAFLREARRNTTTKVEERRALAALCRYLRSQEWMPPHLAAEYGLRAKVREPPTAVEPPEPARREMRALPPIEPSLLEVSAEPDIAEVPAEPALDELEDLELPEDDVSLPTAPRVPPEPVPRPEPPLPLPQPGPGPVPEPEPEPGPEPEETSIEDWQRAELEESRRALEKERADAEAFVRSRTQDLVSKEELLSVRERSVASKEEEVEARSRAGTERLIALEKDSARREVLRFLGGIPGMSAAQADVVATAFPDIASLTAALARSIRLELAPGELEDERRSTRLREEAQAFVAEGNYDAALECYDRLLRTRPEETSVWFDRAELLVLLDRPEEALQAYTRILDVDRGNRQASYEHANLLFGLGRLSVAIDALREALRLDPSKSRDVVQKAEQLRRDGHPKEAVLLFHAILEVAPDDPRAILGLGDTFIDLGDADAAEAQFTRALGKDPQNAPILFRKGELLERKGRWGAAIQYYNRAIALRWNYPEPWLVKGEILLSHDRPTEALECFEKVASFEPQRIEAWAGAAL